LDLFIGGEARAGGYDNYPFKTAECVLIPVHSPSKAERLRDSKSRYFKLPYRERRKHRQNRAGNHAIEID
jgi:hypothetical protein